MAQSSQPTQVVYVERLPPSPSACRLAPGTSSRQPDPFCDTEWLNEEPDREKPFVRFCEGLRHNRCMAEIGWHRRETRRQTENTKVMPIALGGLLLLDKNWNTPLHRRLQVTLAFGCAYQGKLCRGLDGLERWCAEGAHRLAQDRRVPLQRHHRGLAASQSLVYPGVAPPCDQPAHQ